MLIKDTLNEQISLGMMIRSEEAAIKGIAYLTEEHYSTSEYRYIFKAIKNLVEKEKEINEYSVKGELSSFGDSSSLFEILTISDEFYFPEKMDSIIEILEDRRCRRESLEKINKFQKRLQTDPTEFVEIIKDIYSIPSDFKIVDSTIIKPGDSRLEHRKSQLEYRKNTKSISTGYDELDDLITFKFAEGEISIIGARPSNGKSAFKTNLIKNLCSSGIGVASYALEQTLEIEDFRLDSIMTGFSLKDEISQMHKWLATDKRWEKLHQAWEEQAKWNYYLIEGTSKRWAQVRNEMKSLAQDGVKIFFFDLFDRLKEIGEASINKHAKITSILVDALETAKALKVHICLLVQIGRDSIKKKKDPYPRLVDLKESGSYEEFARLVLLLHYPKAHDRTMITSPIEIIIAKQSNGPLVSKDFRFDEKTLLISNNTVKPIGNFPKRNETTK